MSGGNLANTERAEFGDTLRQKSLGRGSTQFQRQQIHMTKKAEGDQKDKKRKKKEKKKSDKKKAKDKKDKEKITRKKSRVLKRKQILFKGENELADGDSNKILDEQIQKDSLRLRDIYKFKKFLILPDDSFKEKWEIIIIIVLLFTAGATPYRIAFVENDDIIWSSLDNGVDCIFLLDIFLNFFTAF